MHDDLVVGLSAWEEMRMDGMSVARCSVAVPRLLLIVIFIKHGIEYAQRGAWRSIKLALCQETAIVSHAFVKMKKTCYRRPWNQLESTLSHLLLRRA